MLPWALVFVVWTIMVAALGIGGLAGSGIGAAQFVLVVVVSLLGIALFANVVRRVR